ncbi:hypothetical protein WA026_009420 [Henosepilachna vigintioctopunctata]|uniref:Uncharacterized protein n=1 Tax=Henosepilachna vigintioctopunctata TaxID=420089 RepID=A0AAW1TVM6_9CUCU
MRPDRNDPKYCMNQIRTSSKAAPQTESGRNMEVPEAMFGCRALRDISSGNINIHNLNKRAKDPERIHELKPSDLTKNDEKMSQDKRENLSQNEWTEVKSRRNKSLRPKGIICKGIYFLRSGFMWVESQEKI